MAREVPSSGPGSEGLVAWFVGNHVAANLLMLFLVGGGLLAVFSMRTELFPAVDPRLIRVQVPYPGATTQEVEDGVTRRVEEAVMGVEGVKQVTSLAQENLGAVTLDVEDFADIDEVLDDVETAVAQLADFPPRDADEPVIAQVRPQPSVMTLVLHGDVPELTLKKLAEHLEEQLLRLKSVSLVRIFGARDYEISIEASEKALRKYELTLEELGRAVAAASQDISAGTIESKAGDVLLRVQEKAYTGRAFGEAVVRSRPDGALLRLRDFAQVTDGLTDQNLVARYNGRRAVFIGISRSESQDALAVERAVRRYLRQVRLPAGVEVDVLENQTELLRQRINLLGRNALMGFALVFLVLLLFLDLKLAFWTSLGIPISFLGGLLIVYMFGLSFNMITLFALIVVLGIVVDDAIVTGESIFVEQESEQEGDQAAVAGVRAVRAPVTVGVLTTVAAFAPLAFTTGVLGQILRPIPVFVISILLVSLLEAFTVLPAHLSGRGRWSRGAVSALSRGFNRFLDATVERAVLPGLRRAFRWRYAVLAAFVALLVAMAGMTQGDIVRFIFFPQIEGDEVTALLVMPVGTPFPTMRRHAETMVEAARTVAGELEELEGKRLFKSVSVLIGATFEQGLPVGDEGVGATTSNRSQLRIQLIDAPRRTVSAGEIERRLQLAIGSIPNADELSFRSGIVQGGADINIQLAHDDVGFLAQAADRLKDAMSSMDGVVEVADTLKFGKLEYVFEPTAAGLAAGLKAADIGRQLRYAFYGYEVQRIQRAREELKVMVRYPRPEREQLQTLQDVRVTLPSGEQAPLEAMTRIRQQRTYAQIRRVNGQRVVNVTADVDARKTTPGEAISVIMRRIAPDLRADYPGLTASVAGESEDRREDMASLGRNMLIALLVIFVLLGAQLKSYAQPFIIMAIIPFGMMGAVIGHLLLGFDLSFVSIFGLVALTGVVVNDSVVLIDYYNSQRREHKGRSALDAVCNAVRRRFRPILLTTMTTSFGLLPMLLEQSLQARFLIPMAISLAFGLIFASVILVFLLPVLIGIVEDLSPAGHK